MDIGKYGDTDKFTDEKNAEIDKMLEVRPDRALCEVA